MSCEKTRTRDHEKPALAVEETYGRKKRACAHPTSTNEKQRMMFDACREPLSLSQGLDTPSETTVHSSL